MKTPLNTPIALGNTGLLTRGWVNPLFAENGYIIHDHQEAWVIDPGGNIPGIMDYIDQQKLRPLGVLNTHGHVDHVAGVAELMDQFRQRGWEASFWMHQADLFLLQNLPMTAQMYGFCGIKIPRVDHFIQPGVSEWRLGQHPIRCEHNPGHSPGCVTFVVADQFLFVGDFVFQGSIGRVDLPGSAPEQMTVSLKHALKHWRDEYQLFPGHGEPTTWQIEKRTNPFLDIRNLR